MTMRRWVNWVNVMLGVWLIVSPWLLASAGGDQSAAWNSWSVGIGVVTLAFFAMYRPAVWRDAVGAMLGAWLMASPWTLALTGASATARNAVTIGLLVIAYAFWAMLINSAGRGRKLLPRRPAVDFVVMQGRTVIASTVTSHIATRWKADGWEDKLAADAKAPN